MATPGIIELCAQRFMVIGLGQASALLLQREIIQEQKGREGGRKEGKRKKGGKQTEGGRGRLTQWSVSILVIAYTPPIYTGP